MSGEQVVINMVGEKVALGPLQRELVPLYHRWDNDFGVLRTLSIPRPSSLEEAYATYDAQIASERDHESAYFTVYERTMLVPIGLSYLFDINYRDRTADFIVLIGEDRYRGRGFGTEATSLTLDYAFTAVGVHNVFLQVWEFNTAAFRAYEKAGFRECGRRHQSKWMGGRLWDRIYMECLASDFKSPLLEQVLLADLPRSATMQEHEGQASRSL